MMLQAIFFAGLSSSLKYSLVVGMQGEYDIVYRQIQLAERSAYI